jgi:hypothetical protein
VPGPERDREKERERERERERDRERETETERENQEAARAGVGGRAGESWGQKLIKGLFGRNHSFILCSAVRESSSRLL